MELKINAQLLFNEKGERVGCILTANILYAINSKQKAWLEFHLKGIAFDIYQDQGLLIFSEINNDWAKIVVLTDKHATLPQTDFTVKVP